MVIFAYNIEHSYKDLLSSKKVLGLNNGFYIVFISVIQQETIKKQKRKIASVLGLSFMQWV